MQTNFDNNSSGIENKPLKSFNKIYYRYASVDFLILNFPCFANSIYQHLRRAEKDVFYQEHFEFIYAFFAVVVFSFSLRMLSNPYLKVFQEYSPS